MKKILTVFLILCFTSFAYADVATKNLIIRDEGATEGPAKILDFTGSGVDASVASGIATVTISGSESTTVSDTTTLDLTLTGTDIKGDVILLKDLVTTAPLAGGTNDILVGADADVILSLTTGIANTNAVVIDAADVADNDYAKFTASGLEGRSYSEVLSDIGAQAADADLTTWAGITPGANVGTFLATPSSANLLAAVTDETGSASGTPLAVFNQNPTINGATLAGVIDAGGATSVEVPNGANPTVSVGGQISIDTSATSGSALRFYGDAQYTLPGWQRIGFVLLNPVATDDYSIGSFPANITIKQIRVLCTGGTNVVGGLDEADANGANVTAIDADITATAGTTATDDGSLTNATVDANDMLNWHTTSISGTPTSLTVTIYFVWDNVN